MLALSRRLIIVSLSIALIVTSLILQYGVFEEFPPFPYFDEVYTLSAAKVVASDPSSLATDHPPLVPYLMQVSQNLFGEGPAAWRLPARLCGSLSLAAVFLIGFSLTGSVIGPLFGAVALLFDGLFLTLTRTATWDTPYVCFGLWALLAALSASHQKNLTLTYALYLVTAGLLGLSISCKWAGLFFFAPIAVAILLGRTPRGTLQRATAVMAIPFVALSVYLVVTCLLRRLSLLEFFDQTKHVFTFHINFIQPHRYVSPPWSWPLLVRPLWFGYQELPYLASDGSQAARGMICLGNPAVFLITGLSTFALLCILVRDAIQKLLFLPIMVPIVGYLSCWIPWMLFTNRNGFIYYFYPSLTFACIGLGVTISRLWTRGRWIATLCGFALSLIIICGALYFPVYFSIPTSQEYMETLLFRESWW